MVAAVAAWLTAAASYGASPVAGNTARTFNDVFADTTVRFDYVLGGNHARPSVNYVGAQYTPGWYGRTARMDSLMLLGNGRLTITDAVSADTLYRTSFSTLYQEWLALDDSVERAFEMSVPAPVPHRKANVTLDLNDGRTGRQLISHRFTFDPADILIRKPAAAPYDTVMLHRGDYPGNRIQVVILPEGFTADSLDVFHTAAREAVEAILAHEPFASLADRFDFIAVDIPSHDYGVSVPLQNRWADTPFHSHFSTFYSDRYLTTPDVHAVHNALNGIPYEHIIILANTDVYGGGGIYNSYTLTSTGHDRFHPVVVHEFGHSFGGLADEYFYDDDVMTDTYPLDIEPWEKNITTLVDFDTKWNHLLTPDVPRPTPVSKASEYAVGLYEGGGYSKHGIYRPADNCRMRTNSAEAFCPACQDALRRLILYYTDPE